MPNAGHENSGEQEPKVRNIMEVSKRDRVTMNWHGYQAPYHAHCQFFTDILLNGGLSETMKRAGLRGNEMRSRLQLLSRARFVEEHEQLVKVDKLDS